MENDNFRGFMNFKDVEKIDIEKVVEAVMEIVNNFVKGIERLNEFEDMSTTEFHIFLIIASKRKIFNSELSQMLGISRSLVSLNLRKLLIRKLIEFKESKEDRRYTIVYLSKKGEKIYRKFLSTFENTMKEAFFESSDEELSKVAAAFEIILNLSRKFPLPRKR